MIRRFFFFIAFHGHPPTSTTKLTHQIYFAPSFFARRFASLAWRSIVDGMASLKLQTNYQLLVSIYNPNYFSAEILSGTGTFQYDGAFVGTMNFGSLEGEKPVNIAANAVTDLLVTTTFSPDKWQLMELTAEYYEGKLEFVISSQSTIKVPAIDYTFTTKVEGMKIKIGSFGDRHLCACPLWG